MAQLRDLLVSGASRFLNGMNINGNIAIGGNILPATTKTYDIGSSSLLWNYIYSDYGKFVDGLGVGISPVTNYAFAVSGKSYFEGDLEPSVTDTYSLGKSGTVFKNGYINNLYGLTLTYNAATINGTLAADDATLGDLLVTGATSLVGPVTFGAAEANRIVWTDANKDLIAANHYADATHIGINTTTYNDLKSYNFYVNGTSCFVPSTTNSASAWGVSIRNGLLAITNFGNTLTIGAQNSSWAHFVSDQDFYFSNDIQVNGTLKPYVDSSVLTGTRDLGDSTHRWKALYVGTADSYGNTGQPVFWNTGVPQAIDWHIGNSGVGEHNANNITYNMIGYYTSNGPLNLGELSTDGAIYAQAYSSSWVGQIAQDYRNGNLFVRGKNNGTWKPWKAIATADSEYTLDSTITYIPSTKTFKASISSEGWSHQVYSNCGFKDGCSITFKPGQTTSYIMMGLNSDPITDANWSSLDYAVYLQANGNIDIRESGSTYSFPTGHTSYAAGDEFTIEYSNGFVRYYHNGVLCRTTARAVGDPLYLDSSFSNSGYVYDVCFGPIKSQALPTTDNAIARFNSSTGALQNSTITIDDNGNIVPDTDNSQQNGCSSAEWSHTFTRTIATRHLDASGVYTGDHDLYIGYGASNSAYTTATKMYYSSSTDSRTQFFEINSNGAYALTRFGVNGQNVSYTFYVNGTSYFNGNTTHNGIVYFANGTTYYINNSGTANLNAITANGVLRAAADCNFVCHGNEVNTIPTLTSSIDYYLNYRQTGGNNTAGYVINAYKFCNGAGTVLATISSGQFSGNAATATALTSDAGSLTLPVYFNSGKPVACSSTLGVSITGNAATATNATNATNATIAGTRWTGITAGQTWSRICLLTPTTNSVSGFSGLLHLNCTRGNVVCNASFIINCSHTTGYSHIVQLNSNSYSQFQIRLVTNSSSSTYIELYDTAYSITSGTQQGWNCAWIPFGFCSITTYTSFTSGATIPSDYAASSTKTVQTGGAVVANKVYGAIWNDYAEYRNTLHNVKAGRCVYECGDGSLKLANQRLLPGANIVSDTFGFAIGETDKSKTPLAVSGRVLAYPNEDRYSYAPGDPVCSGPNGTISKMTRDEVMKYPERIVGTVSEIPEYFTWGTGNVKVDGRIWIKIR